MKEERTSIYRWKVRTKKRKITSKERDGNNRLRGTDWR